MTETLANRAFYYLRHGQTDWNLGGRAQGQTDVGLNDHGKAQASSAVPKLIRRGITAVCASPLRRARETASIIGNELRVPIHIVDDLKEASWGECEGMLKGSWFEEWKDGVTPADAEPFDLFIARALRGLNTALALGERVLVVAHGGTYWAVERATGIPIGHDLSNCTPVYHEPPSTPMHRWNVEMP